MAKKKSGDTPPSKGPKPNGLVIRCSPEYRDWIKRSVAFTRSVSAADLIDKALVAFMRDAGFKEGAPKR
jgi:hypothetical protein